MAYGRAGNSPYPAEDGCRRWPSWSRQASGATHRGQEFPGRHHPLREKGLRVPRHRHDRSDPVPASALSELNPSVLTPWRRATSRQTKKPDKCRQTMAAARSSGRWQPNRRAGASSQGATDASSESWPRWPIGSRNFPRRPHGQTIASAHGTGLRRGKALPIHFRPIHTGTPIPDVSWRDQMWLDTWI